MTPRIGLHLLYALLLVSFTAAAQIESFGLNGRTIYDLGFYGGRLYAATDTGVFVWREGASWKLIGLDGKKVITVYPHDWGPIGYAVTAGVQRALRDSTLPLIYCTRYSDTAWVPADSGINRASHSAIRSIRGFPSPLICGELFAGGEGRVYMGLGGVWKQVLDLGVGIVNVVRTQESSTSVWVGGETTIFAPYIARSRDKGQTWAITYPFLGGDNACDALAIPPTDSLVAYGGMEGLVIKTTDGGRTWQTTPLAQTPYYFYAMEYEPVTKTLVAGGASSAGGVALYTSTDEGGSWNSVALPLTMKGIRCATVGHDVPPGTVCIFLGTLGSGVFKLNLKLTSVQTRDEPTPFRLDQNYPNPFNATTGIRFQVSGISRVRLVVYDLLGRKVTTLVDEHKPAGAHTVQFDASGLASGVYLYRMTASPYTFTHTMVLMK